ncbi:hypothetical protein [Streptomyces lincolnensis]|uniref:hypothetical protein n=1 Tax=Streptomyces lincolnensis TaxID=1915 RepID=UPI0037D285A0
MRGTAQRAWVAGLATVALAAGLTACSGGSDEKDERAKACTDGTYAWSGVQRSEKLVELADPIRFEKTTSSYAAELKPVDDTVHRVTVSTAPEGVGAAGVIKALGRHLKVEEPLAGPSETWTPEEQGHYYEAAAGDYKGDYYSWGSIRLVDADFTYTCGSGDPVKGHVTTWEGTGTGFLPCASDPVDSPAARTAALQTCPAGSPAAKDT